MIYVADVPDADYEMVEKLKEVAASEGAHVCLVLARVEAELVQEDNLDFLEALRVNLEDCGL